MQKANAYWCAAVVLLAVGIGRPHTVWGEARVDHTTYDKLLGAYVDDRGLVDYDGLCQDPALGAYTAQLSASDPGPLAPEAAMAFWINAYNAFTLQVICDHYPVQSINELHGGGLVLGTVFKTTIWDRKWFQINGEKMSLGHIEHEILRKKHDTRRIHFAIVCAAKSCPPLRNEAYTAALIDAQLEDQGRRFLNREDLNRFDSATRTAYLSGIFKWFRKDFGRGKREMLPFIRSYVGDPAVRESLSADPGAWKLKWMDYDWSLNRQPE